MAKGFTVKAKTPKVNSSSTSEVQQDWDYEKIKARMRGKAIVFCLPGRGCSYTFLKSFVQLCFDLVQNGMNIQISQDYSSMVNFARCKCLGANVLRGPHQIPWDGKLPYDYQLWIDNDIVFDSKKFWQLCDLAFPDEAVIYKEEENENGEMEKKAVFIEKQDQNGNVISRSLKADPEKDRPIAAGWYCTEDGKTTSVAHWLEEDDFRNNGGVMNHEMVDGISKRRKPFTVDYTGFGWVMIKHGVFEHEEMRYPWFAPQMQSFESGEVEDMCGEDVSFCLDAKEAGFEIWCDPRIRVGHEKTRII